MTKLLALLLWLAPHDPQKTIVDLQPYRETSSIQMRSASGREGTATLVNLNPAINAWYLLTIAWKDGRGDKAWHLENASPSSARIILDEKNPSGVVIADARGRHACDVFSGGALDKGRASGLVYYPLCDGRIYLRNPATGHSTALETATDFLREHVWGGESIISLGHVVMGDTHRETGTLEAARAIDAQTVKRDAPLAARIDPRYAGKLLWSAGLGIDLEGPARTGLIPGAWYPAAGNPGVYVSILEPDFIEPSILASDRNRVASLDNVESTSLCYLIAFDLDRFEIGYAPGTEHPKVGWSEHMLGQMRDPALPGPDGIGTISPLVATGLLSPNEASKTIATFTAGFKREHGAFKSGELALRNHGSHYGFIEDGVVFSKLQPGLSTVFVLADGSLGMKTWTKADDALLPRIRHARQNGVPILDAGTPGPLLSHWGEGNWSGSGEGKLRSMRSGAALQSNGRKRFLLYAVFTSATPAAMARVFQAYQCEYAMLLDMNALEHTYLALYRRTATGLVVDHLVKGMNVLEKSDGGELIPRFLGYADNRDFFYVMRKEAKP